MTVYDDYECRSVPLNRRYKFINNIQAGAFGTVSLAKDVVSGDYVSLKAIKKDLDGVEGVDREIDILKRLKGNEYICQLLDLFEIDSHVVLVLEYCSNGDLYDLIHERSLSDAEIYAMCSQLYLAVQFAHGKGVYHRDIKPENILIDKNGKFKLCDWGLATTERINSDFNVGTEKYMAPETIDRISPKSVVDSKLADYWSFGITLLTSVFGTSPFKAVPLVIEDLNFKKIVYQNYYLILYDIYPSMNSNLYDIVMPLLRVGVIDKDTKDFEERLHERSLDEFMDLMNENWQDGFYVEDYEDEVFNMDHDDIPTKQYATFETEYIGCEDSAVPSLEELTFETFDSVDSRMLWLDMDDEDDWQAQLAANMKKLLMGEGKVQEASAPIGIVNWIH